MRKIIENQNTYSKLSLITFVISLAGLHWISRFDFLLFHTLAELFSIVIGVSVFIIMWTSRRYLNNNFFMIVAIGLFYSSMIDLLHTLSYKGMPFFSDLSPNLPTQLWIAARSLQALTFLMAAFRLRRTTNLSAAIMSYTLTSMGLITLIFSGLFPVCFVEGQGLTEFKIAAEYVISGILLVSAWRLYQLRDFFDRRIFLLLFTAMMLSVGSELAFTFYIDVYGLSNLIGHYFKIGAYYVFAIAFVQVTLNDPNSVIFRDLKEREDELKKARARYQSLFMEAPVSIWEEDFSAVKQMIDELSAGGIQDFSAYFSANPETIKNLAGKVKILALNKTARKSFAHLNIQTGSGALLPLVDSVADSQFIQELLMVAEGKERVILESNFLGPTGELHHSLLHWAVVPGHEADYSRVIVIEQDLTERLRAEQALKESEGRYRLLVENAGAGIAYYSLDGILLFANRLYQVFIGADGNNPIGRNLRELLGKEKGEMLQTRIHQVSFQEESLVFEDFLDSPTGRKWFNSTFTPMLDPSGKCVGVQIILHEITHRKELEQELLIYSSNLGKKIAERTSELEAAQEQLLRQEKMAVLGQMASSVGHELRNPLAVINNALYLLKNTNQDLDPKTLEYLLMISQEVSRSEKIISDLLSFARVKSVERTSFRLEEALDQVLQRLMPPDNIQVESELAQNLHPVYADRTQVEQVLLNLISNACQAMPEGGKLRFSAREKKEMICLSIQDNGAGIAAENLDMIFEPLFTTKPKGIGLGLTVTKLLVEANNGSIKVDSKVGQGSVFTVCLPVKADDISIN